jgi:Putative addiction module component
LLICRRNSLQIRKPRKTDKAELRPSAAWLFQRYLEPSGKIHYCFFVPRRGNADTVPFSRISAINLPMDAKRVIEEALQLPTDARAALAGQLLASLEGVDIDADREAAWSTEIRSRLDTWQRGEMTTVSHSDFLLQLDQAARGTAAT